jgi:hypothetical protein
MWKGKIEGTRNPGRHRCRWVDNTKMGLRKVREGGMD